MPLALPVRRIRASGRSIPPPRAPQAGSGPITRVYQGRSRWTVHAMDHTLDPSAMAVRHLRRVRSLAEAEHCDDPDDRPEGEDGPREPPHVRARWIEQPDAENRYPGERESDRRLQ